MSVKNEHGLTPQQEEFAKIVASGKTLAEAHRLAYPKSVKWADSAIWPSASRIMANSKVSARVKALQAESAALAGLDQAEILLEIRRLALSDIAGIMHADGRIKMPHELDPGTRAAVASFEMGPAGIKYKFWDKNAALEKAGKHLGLFERDNEQSRSTLPTITRIELVGVRPAALTGLESGPARGSPASRDSPAS